MADGLGKEAVAKVREAYSRGEYDAFLTEMEKDYQESLRQNQLEGLAALREAAHVKLSATERKRLDEKFFALKKERNQKLLAAISGQKETEFTQKVRSLATELPEHNWIDFHVLSPGSGETPDENRLIDLDLELEYKSIHLDTLQSEHRREKQLALQMQNADRMAGLVSILENKNLQSRVKQYTDHADAYLARQWDAADLHALGRGKVQPQNEVEQKVADILAIYQAEWSQLAKNPS
jgi:hypothetical protein